MSLTADGGLFISHELLARTMSDLSPSEREILEREGLGKTLYQNPLSTPGRTARDTILYQSS